MQVGCRYIPGPRRTGPRDARGAGALLVLLLVLTVGAADVPVVHDHEEHEPGWYDTECPLLQLAAVRSGAPPTHLPLAITGLPVTDAAPQCAAPVAPHVSPRRAQARAPPTAS